MLEEVSDELLVRIFAACDPECLRNLSTSCKRYYQLCTDDCLWHAVFVKVMRAEPMCRLCPWSWRDEWIKRKTLSRKWSGRDRNMFNFTIPSYIGNIVHMERSGKDVAVIIGESGLLKLIIGDGTKDRPSKRLVFYYSTMFSENAILTAATFGDKNVALGFSNGSIVVLNGLPRKDWSDCSWYTQCSGNNGPPITAFMLRGKFLLSVGQRCQSETAGLVQVFNLKTRSKTFCQVIPDYSFCSLREDGSVFVPQRPHIQCQVEGVLVGRDGLYIDDKTISVDYSSCFSNDRNLVLLTEECQLCLFSPSQQAFSARIKMKTKRILDVLVLDEALIVACEEGMLFVVDAVGGGYIAKRAFKRKPGPFKFVVADAGNIWFLNGNEFTVFSIKDQIMSPSAAKPKKANLDTKKDLQVNITEALREQSEEKVAEAQLDRLRSSVNIEGLSEAELIQYAQLLSLDQMQASESELMSESMSELMNEQTNEQMNEQMNE